MLAIRGTPSLRWTITIALLLPLILALAPVSTAQAGFLLLVKPAFVQAAISKIEPSSTWAGSAGTGFTVGVPVPVADGVQYGAQAITGTASDGGLIRLTVTSTAHMTDGEQWVVSGVGGTTEANGTWKIGIIDATHVDLCSSMIGPLGSYSCTGPTYTNAFTSGGSIGFAEKAIGNFDDYRRVWIEDTNHTITVAAGSGTRAGIADIKFVLEGAAVDVTSQTINPRTGSQGWAITPTSRTAATSTAKDGDANLYAVITPVNGYQRVLSIPLTLNSNGAINTGRPDRYVDGIAGNDSTGTGTIGAPWATVQKATGAAPSGAVIHVNAASYSCTITVASPAAVTCPTTALVPPATIQLSNIPAGLSGLSAGTIYYVLPDNFSSGSGTSSFEISTLPPGINAADAPVACGGGLCGGSLTTAAFFPSTPVNTSGTGGSVTVQGEVYAEGAHTANNTNARPMTVRPTVPSTVTIKGTIPENLQSSANRTIFHDITFDMSTIIQFNGSGSAEQLVAVENSRLIDPNSPAPPYGYGTGGNTLGAGAFGGNTTGGSSALVDSLVSAISDSLPGLERNTTGWASMDLVSLGVHGNAYSNTAIFNKNIKKLADWIGRATQFTNPTDVKVSSVSYNSVANTTTIGVTGGTTGVPGSGGDNFVTFYSGALDGERFNAPTSSGSTMVLVGNASAAAVGDNIFVGTIGHADAFQITGANGSADCSSAAVENVSVQRYKAERVFTAPSSNGYFATGLQGTLGQTGYCPVDATSTLTASGTTVTISATPTFTSKGTVYPLTIVPDNIISLGNYTVSSGVNAGQQYQISARVKSTVINGDGTQTIQLYAPLTTQDGTGTVSSAFTGWFVGTTVRDVLFQNTIISENPAEFFQYFGGHVDWVYTDSTLIGAISGNGSLSFRQETPGFLAEGVTFFDSILPSISADQNGMPAGISADNSQYMLDAVRVGTNASLGIVGFDSTYHPTSGLIRTRRTGVRINNPWDYNGNPRSLSSSIGAVN